MTFLIIALISLLVVFGAYKLTVGSIERLGTEVGTFYPFDVRVRKTNVWSTLVYLLIIVALFSVIFFFSRGGMTKLPGLPA